MTIKKALFRKDIRRFVSKYIYNNYPDDDTLGQVLVNSATDKIIYYLENEADDQTEDTCVNAIINSVNQPSFTEIENIYNSYVENIKYLKLDRKLLKIWCKY